MENKYSAMTVNERLYVSGLMNEFDKSVKEKDTNKVKSILKEVGITDETTVTAILKQTGVLP
jgi:sulfur carrier protein ThiS